MKMIVAPWVGELAERAEQLVDLLGDEHRGRLVEDQDLGAAVEHLEDLDALLVADAELGDEGVGVDLEAVLLRRVRRSCDSGRPMLERHCVPGS